MNIVRQMVLSTYIREALEEVEDIAYFKIYNVRNGEFFVERYPTQEESDVLSKIEVRRIIERHNDEEFGNLVVYEYFMDGSIDYRNPIIIGSELLKRLETEE